MISLTLIGLRVAQTESTPRSAAVPAPRISQPAPVLSLPSPYRPKWPTARAVRQAAKQRPPVLLGTPGQEALTRYCPHTTGPYGRAIADGGDWVCRPLFGAPVPIRLGRACRFLYGDRAWGVRTGSGDPQTWRCYRNGP